MNTLNLRPTHTDNMSFAIWPTVDFFGSSKQFFSWNRHLVCSQATSIYMITSVSCRAVLSVCCWMSGGTARRPRWLHMSQREGRTVSYREVRGGAISPRSLKQRTARSRCQANSSGDIAARQLPLCACRARQTARWLSLQIQANSIGDRDRTATTSARRTSVAFAAKRKQNASQGVTVWPLPANTLGLQTMEQRLTLARIEIDESSHLRLRSAWLPYLNLGSTDPIALSLVTHISTALRAEACHRQLNSTASAHAAKQACWGHTCLYLLRLLQSELHEPCVQQS